MIPAIWLGIGIAAVVAALWDEDKPKQVNPESVNPDSDTAKPVPPSVAQPIVVDDTTPSPPSSE